MKIDIGSQSHLKKPMVGGDSLKMNEFKAHIEHLHNEKKKCDIWEVECDNTWL